jgi:ABC-type sugar transport system ATPase subunit
MAILMYSSDLDELLDLADRAFAMFGGALIPVARERRAIGEAMLGAGDAIGASRSASSADGPNPL